LFSAESRLVSAESRLYTKNAIRATYIMRGGVESPARLEWRLSRVKNTHLRRFPSVDGTQRLRDVSQAHGGVSSSSLDVGQLRQGHGAVLMLASSTSHLLGEPVASYVSELWCR
jgi:hypothetical protein